MNATPLLDDATRVEMLVEAVRLATSCDTGDPDRLLDAVADEWDRPADVHRKFATLIEATLLLRALRPYMPDASDCLLALYDEAVSRAVIAALTLLCFDVEVDVVDGPDAETERAA